MSTPRRVKYRVSRSYSERMYSDDTNGVYRKLSDNNPSENQIRQEKFDSRNRPLSYAFGSQSFRETGNRDFDGRGQSLILLKQARSRHSLNLPRSFDLDLDLNANSSDKPDDKNTNNNELTPDRDIVKIANSEKVPQTDSTRPQPVTDTVNTTCTKATNTRRRQSSSSDNSSSSDDSKCIKSVSPKRHIDEVVKKISRTSLSSDVRNPAKRSLGSTGSYESRSSGRTSMHDQSFESLEFREPTLIFSTIDPLISLRSAPTRKRESRKSTDSDDDLFESQTFPRPRVALKSTVPALSPRIKRETIQEHTNKEDNESVASERKFQELLDDFDDKYDNYHSIEKQIEEENVDATEPLVNGSCDETFSNIQQQIIGDETEKLSLDPLPGAHDLKQYNIQDGVTFDSDLPSVSEIKIPTANVVDTCAVCDTEIRDLNVPCPATKNGDVNVTYPDTKNREINVTAPDTEYRDVNVPHIDIDRLDINVPTPEAVPYPDSGKLDIKSPYSVTDKSDINLPYPDILSRYISIQNSDTENCNIEIPTKGGIGPTALIDTESGDIETQDGPPYALDIGISNAFDVKVPSECNTGTSDFARNEFPAAKIDTCDTQEPIISPVVHLGVETSIPRPSAESTDFAHPPPLPSSEPPEDLVDGLLGDSDLVNVTESVHDYPVHSHSDSDSESSVCQCDQAHDTSLPETDVRAKMTSREGKVDEHLDDIPPVEIAYYGPIYAKDNTLILPTDLLPRRDSIGSTGSRDKETDDPSSVSNESLDYNQEKDGHRRESYRSSFSASSCEYHLPSGIITTKAESEYLPDDTSLPPQSDISQYHSISSASSGNRDADTTTSGEVIFEWKFSTSKNKQETNQDEIDGPHHQSTISSSTYSSASSLKNESKYSSNKNPVLASSSHGEIIVTDDLSHPPDLASIPKQQESSLHRGEYHESLDKVEDHETPEYNHRRTSSSTSSSTSRQQSVDSESENISADKVQINDGIKATEVPIHQQEIRPIVTILNRDGQDHIQSKENNQTRSHSEKLDESADEINVRQRRPARHNKETEELKFSEPIASSSPKNTRMTSHKSSHTTDNECSEKLEHAIADTETDTIDPESQSRHRGHFVVVAIDFGTTYSGYAFSFTSDPDGIHMMRKWEGGDPGVINQKTPTTVLLTPEGLFHSFGFTARDFYHDLDKEEAKKWLYFDKFKMMLHNTAELSRDTLLRASNGKLCPAISVFAYALQFFKEHALQELSDQSGTKIINDDVRWVISVPAIWKASAKQFMRQAAYEAGLISPDCPDQLVIALEPEAASIYCRKLRIHQLVPDVMMERPLQSPSRSSPEPMNMSPACEEVITGTRYMVVDCGGGTVDITVHEVSTGGKLIELYRASGGPYGSIGVDVEFEKLLCGIFGKEFIEQYKQKRPVGWVDLMIAFESRKRSSSPDKATSLNVALPFSFIDYFKKHKSGHIDLVIKKHADKGVQWSSQGMLRLTPGAMKLLFVPTLDKIKQAIGDVLNHPHTRGLKYLFLVGGFAESRILQYEIRKEFSSLLKVIIPQGTGLTILKGAVLFGLDPTVVNVRKSRQTYGVGVLNKYRADKHLPEKRVLKDGKEWCTDVFDKYVEVDQPIAVGDVVLRSYMPVKSDQKFSQINIYTTENRNANFITDPGVQKCGTLELELLSESVEEIPLKREIQARMQFGETEIKVSALDVTSGTIVQAKIDFLNR